MFTTLFILIISTLTLPPPLLQSATTPKEEHNHLRRLLHQPLFLLHQSNHPTPLLKHSATISQTSSPLPPLLHSTTTPTAENHHLRRVLHQPLFPLDQSLPPSPLPKPLSPSPSPQPKHSTSTSQNPNPFFPHDLSPPLPPPPPPPPPPSPSLTTFPANISSLSLPSSTHPPSKPTSPKLIAIIVILTLLSASAATVAAVLLRRRRTHHHLPLQKQNHPRTDSLRLVPPNTTPSDAKAAATVSKKPPPPPAPPAPVPRNQPGNSTSAEFLYLGTIGSTNSDDHRDGTILDAKGTSKGSKGTTYERLGSPELRPLPPLPRHILDKGVEDYELGLEEEDEFHDEEFFSPRGSSGDHKDVMNSPQEFGGACSLNSGRVHSEKFEGEFDVKVKNVDYRSKSSNCYAYDSHSNSNSSSCSPSLMMNLNSPMSLLSKSPDSLVNFPALPRYIPPPAPPLRAFRPLSPPSSEEEDSRDSPSRGSDFSLQNFGSPMSKNTKLPPPLPPPPPSAGFLGRPAVGLGPPEFVVPSRPVVGKNLSGERKAEESLMMKPKLKTLHWDKVRASSDRSMVWDQLRASSFE